MAKLANAKPVPCDKWQWYLFQVLVSKKKSLVPSYHNGKITTDKTHKKNKNKILRVWNIKKNAKKYFINRNPHLNYWIYIEIMIKK